MGCDPYISIVNMCYSIYENLMGIVLQVDLEMIARWSHTKNSDDHPIYGRTSLILQHLGHTQEFKNQHTSEQRSSAIVSLNRTICNK